MRRLYVAAIVLAACRVGDLVDNPSVGAHLRFAVQPARADPGEVIAPPVQVAVLDEAGRPDTAFHGSVALELAQNPGGATLSGSITVIVAQGIAMFSDLRLDQPGRGYVLRASAPARPAAMSAPFEVVDDSTPVPPATPRLAFTVQPSATQTSNPITPAVRVTAETQPARRSRASPGPSRSRLAPTQGRAPSPVPRLRLRAAVWRRLPICGSTAPATDTRLLRRRAGPPAPRVVRLT